MCMQEHRVIAATIVDHIVPHKGDPDLFWYGALQSLCLPHHNRAKKRQEWRGYDTRIGVDGWPTDSKHPAYSRTTIIRSKKTKI
jgi:5-methylcytosine-specific restriction protein A